MVTNEEPKVNPNARYTVTETCALLTISRPTLYGYVRAGYIKPYTPVKRPRELQARSPRTRFLGSEIARFWLQWV